MDDKKFGSCRTQHSEISDRIVEDLHREVSRRDVMKTLLAGGLLTPPSVVVPRPSPVTPQAAGYRGCP